LAINLALLFVLLGIGAMQTVPIARKSGIQVINLLPRSSGPQAPARKTAMREKSATRPDPPRPRVPRIVPPTPTLPENRPLDLLVMTKEEFAAADVSRLGKAGADAGSRRNDDSEEVGHGPNGEVLYAAEWAREPTDAELGGYLPRNAPEGYGLIACRTLPQNRVDDCIELDNYPRGSHLASAVRQAAWQFRVRPPRKNGREMIGQWVRIRIDYTRNPAE
jgi:protein TonB